MAVSRLFVGLWLPDTVAGEVLDVLLPLQRRHAQLAWQPRARWHITLAFLGDRDEERSMKRFARLKPGVAGPVRLRGIGVFGPIVWVGVDGGDWLPDLARAVREVCHVRDERRFRAHVTVGRARGPAAAIAARRVPVDAPEPVTSRWVPQEVCLVRSTTGPRPNYETIARVGLPSAP